MIQIDGSFGEGGGQILRTSLALSAITGKAFSVKNIRANRKKPGLMRQHLTGVEATAKICQAVTNGASLNSQSLEFVPHKIIGGDFSFHIGTAGSTTLVLQTILYPLLYAKVQSKVEITGGTHNDKAPPFEFILKSFLPLLKKMGVALGLKLERAGFYPAGGGSIQLTVNPVSSWQTLTLLERGSLVQEKIIGVLSRLPATIVEREANTIRKLSRQSFANVEIQEHNGQSAGNAVLIEQENENVTNVFTAFGGMNLSAEKVGKKAYLDYRAFNDSLAPVGEYLADQLLLPMALAGEGEMIISERSLHFDTNVEIIKQFLDVQIDVEKSELNGFYIKLHTTK